MSPAPGRGRGSDRGATGGRGGSGGAGRGRGGQSRFENPPGSTRGGSTRGASGSSRGAAGRGASGSSRGGSRRDADAGLAGGGTAGRGLAAADRSLLPGGRRAGTSGANRGLGGDLVEGRQAVRELLLAGRRRVTEVLLANDLDAAPVIDDIIELAREQRVPVRELSRTKLDATARTDAPQGVIARAAPLPEVELERLAKRRGGRAPFLLAVDGVTDPGNLGALLRSAECAGVTGLVLPRHRAVHITPTVAKAAAGAIEHVPMSVVGGLPTALATLSKLGVWVVGLDADGDRPVHDMTFAAEPVVLVLGAEGKGLSRLVRQRCDAVVSIPLQGKLPSLNVAAAGAVACYEVLRQRDLARAAEQVNAPSVIDE